MFAHVAQLVVALQRIPLLDPTQLCTLTNEFQPRFSEPAVLARELVRLGWLTSFQESMLLQGKGDRLVLGSYVLLDELGQGSTSTVFKARNKLGPVVVLKRIHERLLSHPTAVHRFGREILATAQLQHPNVVQCLDADHVDGRLFMIAEYVEGTNLYALVERTGTLPLKTTCEYVRQVACGLQYIHEHQMVHRDIKPSNMLLDTRTEVVKIADLGMALLSQPLEAGATVSAITQEGVLVGTPNYMAPEQAQHAHTVDIRADLYSLGCSFYYLLTGQVPFPTGTVTERLAKHCKEQPASVQSLRPEVPSGIAALVRRLMAKRPEDRFQTPGEVERALSWLLGQGMLNKPTSDEPSHRLPPQQDA